MPSNSPSVRRAAPKRPTRRRGLALALACATAPALLAATAPAGAEPPRTGDRTGARGAPRAAGTPAIVSMGDSYISGEAGRWWSNVAKSDSDSKDLYGTDRACMQPDGQGNCAGKSPQTIYQGGTYVNPETGDKEGCHRSDVAEVESARIPGLESWNLACSGAVTQNVWRQAQGGKPYKGFPAQADQLQMLLDGGKDVRWIQLSIGGNDLQFSDIIKDCVYQYLESYAGSYCHKKQRPLLKKQLEAEGPQSFAAKVRKTIRDIRSVMQDRQYRLVVQSYPAPIPLSQDFSPKFPESKAGALSDRHKKGGCSFWNQDANWAHSEAVAGISNRLRQLAQEEGADFLDLSSSFDRHEVCHKDTRQAQSTDHLPNRMVPDKEAEWMRFLTRGIKGIQQGQEAESLHPNAWGQKALGNCLKLAYAKARGTEGRMDLRCLNTPGQGVNGMYLS